MFLVHLKKKGICLYICIYIYKNLVRVLGLQSSQDAVVPHNLVEFSISLRSVSGFPATMNGHVCEKEKKNNILIVCNLLSFLN